MPETKPEILIVGAGPSGLTAATELTRRGITPTIIDNDGLPTPESRALAIHARTLDILEPAGITERLLKAGNIIKGFYIRHNGKNLLHLNFKDLPHRFNFILALPQSKTEEIMIEALKEKGLDVNWHTTLEAFEKTEAGYKCSFDKGSSLETSNFDMIIGADGAHSTVRKQLGVPFDGESIPGEWSLADVEWDDWPHPVDHAIINLTPNGPLAFFPLGEGYGRLVSSRPGLLNHIPKEAKLKKVIWESNFRISYRQVKTYQQNNVFLVGDAAHIHSPAGGRGMNLGIEDAATLAYLIKEDRTRDYTKQRHPIGRKVLKFTEQQTRQFTSTGPFFRLMVKYLAPLILAFPALRKAALSQMTGLDTPKPEWLPDSERE